MQEPVPHIKAHPSPSNLLEWHFVLEGASGTPFEGGIYHGKLVFPPNYPFKPPSISIFTPNGRFATNTKLCLSITDYHPESWNPMWSVGTILTGLLSFMYDNQPTTGSITSSDTEKQQLARASLAFNAKHPMFRKLFPEWVELHTQREQQQQQGLQQQQQQQAPGRPDQQQHPHTPSAAAAAAGLANGTVVPAAAAVAAGGGGAPGTAAGGAAAAHQGGGLFTVALLVLVIALAAVPLLNSGGGGSMTAFTERLARPPR
jgi:ubiquitin-conjugating enzyme E2 J2